MLLTYPEYCVSFQHVTRGNDNKQSWFFFYSNILVCQGPDPVARPQKMKQKQA